MDRGQVSIGGFRRDIKNFFGSTVFRATPEFLSLYGLEAETYGDCEVSTQRNLPGNVRMTGLEFEYRQALTFLPHWARGVRVFANGTALRATGEASDNFSDLMPRSASWGASLTRSQFTLRLNWNYQSRRRLGVVATGRSIEPGTYNWSSMYQPLDLQAEYYFLKRFAVFANLRNVTGEPIDTEVAGPSTPAPAQFRQRNDIGSLWTIGLKGTF